jgi:hypothetical protein
VINKNDPISTEQPGHQASRVEVWQKERMRNALELQSTTSNILRSKNEFKVITFESKTKMK